MSVLKPDFFVVGAPKCGTTSLCDYLGQHPDCFIPNIKELHYFGADLTGDRAVTSLEDYLALFEGYDSKVCGDGSTWYLYSGSASTEIYDHNPEAKIVVMLRNPIDVMCALHNQMLFDGVNEDIQDFREALLAEDDREKGRRIPRSCKRREALLYTRVVRFCAQIKRYFDVFGESSVHVIIYEDFSKDTQKEFFRAAKFLELDPQFVPEFRIKNARKYVRSPMLRFAIRAATRHGRVLKGVPFLGGALRSMRLRAISLNTVFEPGAPLNSEFRHKLSKDFSDEINSLSELLGRDLSAWRD